MTTFILAPAVHTAADAVVASPAAMLDAGQLVAYSERANGTTRHLELCPVGSTRRDTAEWISERLDDGATLKTVARELHVSVPTVRRFIMALELTEEIEAGEWDDVWASTQGFEMTPEEEELAGDCGWEDCELHGTIEGADQPCPLAVPEHDAADLPEGVYALTRAAIGMNVLATAVI